MPETPKLPAGSKTIYQLNKTQIANVAKRVYKSTSTILPSP